MKIINTILLSALLITPLGAEESTITTQSNSAVIAKVENEASLKKQGYYDSSKHSRRPYDNYDSYNFSNHRFGDSSRYSTSQGWSRGRDSYWWGRYNDMPSAGYSSSTLRK